MLLRFRAFEALRHSEYRLIWYGQIFASMGTWMDQVTRGWLIYELTNSSLQLGLVSGIQAIPYLLMTPARNFVHALPRGVGNGPRAKSSADNARICKRPCWR